VSSTNGFGGNGDSGVGEEIVDGHCITDGPLAHFQILYIDDEYHSHCLSRGFLDGEKLRELGEWFRPTAIDRLMEQDNYDHFLLKLEDGPHITIPRNILGDYSMLTAPSGEYACNFIAYCPKV
jgi:tyrosinase